MGTIHLKAEGGIPIGMSLPLHETIAEQWRNGALKRVTADGGRWEGDEFDLTDLEELSATPETSEPDAAGGETEGEGDDGESGRDPDDEWAEPARPDDAAPVKAWRDYAAALGATTAEEAAGMSKPDLIKLCTPPEADPLAEV